ncbi:hypothetical protein DFH11DRAFT_1232999 [Phellopilus nigrolimitatus]|nr:hypothetical protein DFH11DRAFT_1232999 [Phellopilus nigrolimitatus]
MRTPSDDVSTNLSAGCARAERRVLSVRLRYSCLSREELARRRKTMYVRHRVNLSDRSCAIEGASERLRTGRTYFSESSMSTDLTAQDTLAQQPTMERPAAEPHIEYTKAHRGEGLGGGSVRCMHLSSFLPHLFDIISTLSLMATRSPSSSPFVLFPHLRFVPVASKTAFLGRSDSSNLHGCGHSPPAKHYPMREAGKADASWRQR